MEIITTIKKCSQGVDKDIFVEFLEKTNQSVKNLKTLSGIIKNSTKTKLGEKESLFTDDQIAPPAMSNQVKSPSNGPVDENMFQDEDIFDDVMDTQRSRTYLRIMF
jgi:hypothetical protein